MNKYYGYQPSLVIHLYPNHFKFDAQDDYFLYTSPMKSFLEHLKTRTIPHDMVADLTEAEVPFYEGCLIVQVYDHKTVAAEKEDEARPSSRSKQDIPNSIHKYSLFVTPSPSRPFPKEAAVNGHAKKSDVDMKEKPAGAAEQGSSSASSSPQGQKSKTPSQPKVSTLVLFPTQQSRQADIAMKACNPRGSIDSRQDGSTNGVPPTPSAAVPPTPTGSSMPPPSKKVKRERMDLDRSNIYSAEGAMLLATLPPLDLEPTKDAVGTIAKIEEQAGILEQRFHAAPKPKTRKRTVAEMAADEAQAAENERYLLTLDDRNGQGGNSVPGGDGQQQAPPFDPTFERFKKIEEIKREHAERAKQEKIKAAENERKLQEQKLQQQAQLQQQQQQQAAEERSRREQAAAQQAQQEELRRKMQQQQMQRMQAQAQAQAAQAQQNQALANMNQNPHAHPIQNGQINGVPVSLPVSAPNGMPMAQARLQGGAASQPPASSPMVQHSTPQNMSSPMVGAVPMQASGSSMGAGSPARPPSVVNQPPMSAPMAASMSARGSQQSHPSGTPRMPHATPNMAHTTPMSRAQQMANTPRMTQASPPPNMMAPQMSQAMMANQAQAMAQLAQNPNMEMRRAQLLAAQQQQARIQMMQNGMMNGNIPQQIRQQFIQQQQARMQGQMGQNPQQMAQNPQMMGQNPQMMARNQQLMAQQIAAMQQAQRIAHGGGQNMVNINGVSYPNQQAMQQLQQQQQQQQQQLQLAQQQQGHPQQMQQQQMMGQAGQQAALQRNMQQQLAQRLFHGGLAAFLQSRGLTQQTASPGDTEEFKRQCLTRAQAMVMQQRQQNAQNPQHQMLLQQQQAQLIARQQAMQQQAMQNMMQQGM